METVKQSFRLEKWYLDVCDDSGNVFIGYSMKIVWRRMHVNYRGYIHRNNQGKVSASGKISDALFPVEDENSIVWSTPEVNGTWISHQQPITETVVLTDPSSFNWQCRQPLSRVCVAINDDVRIEGMGYAEKIVLDLPPWKLPISTLHWGRFTSEHDSVIWIKWIGAQPLTIVYVNGQRSNEIDIDTTGIRFPGGSIKFGELHSLRTGKLSETVLRGFSFLRKIFPVRALSIEENKWTCSAIFTSDIGTRISGQCIHEIVDFAD